MSQYRDSNSGSLASLISGAVLGAAGLAWWLLSEAEKRQETRKQKAMLYAPRIQDGSEATELASDIDCGTASSATNAGTLDGHDSTVFLRSNTADSFTG